MAQKIFTCVLILLSMGNRTKPMVLVPFLSFLLICPFSIGHARTAENIKISNSEHTNIAGAGISSLSATLLEATTVQIQDALGLLTNDVISISTGSSDSLGFEVFGNPTTLFPTQGQNFFVMSTGAIQDVLTPNTSSSTSTVLNGLNNSQGEDMVQAILVLQPPATASCLAFDFAFYSEEFPEYVGSQFNDVFIAEIGQSVFQIVDNQVIAPNNFAFDTEGNVISINTVFGVTPEDANGTTYDAGTSVLTAKTPLEKSGEPITVTLSIMDLGDSIFDSTVFIDNFRWLFGVACEPGADTDADRDSLLDSWEKNGIDFDNDGTVDLDLPSMGANFQHKDIFVEIDYMDGIGHTHKPLANALQIVIEAFQNAPVLNPDGNNGINIHIDAGQDTIMNPVTGETWGSMSQSNVLPHQNYIINCSEISPGEDKWAFNWTAFDAIKGIDVPGSFSIQRADVFHYNVWGHHLCPEFPTHRKLTSGLSRDMPASDFIVTLGGWDEDEDSDNPLGVGTVNQQAGTLMHELGHNLSLRHGGNDDLNKKPNYLSVMNYLFQMRGLRKFSMDGNFNYSPFQLPSLNEGQLNEESGLKGIAGTENYGTRYHGGLYDPVCDPDDPNVDPHCIIQTIENIFDESIDWNQEMGFESNVQVNVNGDTETSILNSKNDWEGVVFNGGAVGHLGEVIELPVVIEDPEGALLDVTEAEDAAIPTDIAVSMNGPFKAFLAPGQSRVYNYTVYNTGDTTQNFIIDAEATQNWANLSGVLPLHVWLDPDMATSINIQVTVPAETTIGSMDSLTVTAHSSVNPLMKDSVETTTIVDIPATKDQCKDGGWQIFGFVNQGQCIKLFNTGK